MLKKLLYIFLILTICTELAGAVELLQYNGPGIIIRYEPPLENAAKKISAAYPEIRNMIEDKIGWRLEFIPRVILIHQRDMFRRMAQNDLITAFAVPGKNHIVMDYSKLDRKPYDLQETFEHELYHLLLHHQISAQSIPKWLDEGVAQWASGGIADIMNPGGKDILKQAVLSENLLPLKDITLRFPGHSRGLLLAYQESKSVVEFIVHEYGEEKLLSILNSLKEGKSVEKSVSENLSIELNMLEQNWQQSLKRKYSWMSYFANRIYWIIFFAAALVTLIGYLRFRRRLKKYRDEEEDSILNEGDDI